MGNFGWARSNNGYEILTQKLAIFEVRIEHSCDSTFTARLNWTWPSSSPWNSDDFPFFWFLHCTSRIRARPFWKLVNICQNLINQLCRPGQPAQSWWWSWSNFVMGGGGVPPSRTKPWLGLEQCVLCPADTHSKKRCIYVTRVCVTVSGCCHWSIFLRETHWFKYFSMEDPDMNISAREL